MEAANLGLWGHTPLPPAWISHCELLQMSAENGRILNSCCAWGNPPPPVFPGRRLRHAASMLLWSGRN